ncbi:type II toxin-antitoxin system HicA family toxin [Pelomicrobium methylotrophicum]|uniref:Type II toxin-antitoxin system HicA family toxin n=1 Tax=Pelomicrobium methylotrophicum TaxID=2602750 RepID=A0A5C7EEB0_9PROT|nr:type II toxin-antitoxin system HicA family toxin [Pelomicrobium methylotrophicum]TXF09819.1 type II toxin-antitoxin system HicA family toxin [Pelomicrobium methylotrophicum]
MTKREKLLAAIRSHPKAVRFEDACKAAEAIGPVRAGGKGSHMVYARAGEPVILNFQNRNGYIPPYQARRLIEMLDKYEG